MAKTQAEIEENIRKTRAILIEKGVGEKELELFAKAVLSGPAGYSQMFGLALEMEHIRRGPSEEGPSRGQISAYPYAVLATQPAPAIS